MNISYAWIRSLLPSLEATPQEIADTLAMQGAPVDEIVDIAGPLRDIRIARVVEASRHPNADRLNLCKVDAGDGQILQVVCGAPNVKSGGVYPFAAVGAHLPGDLVIRKSKIRGEESQGMLCSARELGLGKEHDGIMELPADSPIGGSLIDVLHLDDARIVVDVTPNRPDLLSHIGIARELGASYGIEPRLPPMHGEAGGRTGDTAKLGARAPTARAGDITVDIVATDLCPRYLGLIIRGVRVAPSPAWLSGPLRAIGLRPISNVVDATNFVLHELGQPLHAFDAKKAGTRIVVRRAADGERITTLDGIDRKLTADMLVIADANRPIAIAGVMGGAETEVDDDTTDILLECALFQPASVRATRRALGLSTDASYRFERGVDPDMMETALRRTAALIVACAGGVIDEVIANAGGDVPPRPPITLRLDRVERLLGVPFDRAAVTSLLSPLGYDVAGDAADAEVLSVRVPGHRTYDVTREVDLIEDIARRHGYDNFPDDLRAFRPTAVPDDAGAQLEDRLRTKLVGLRMLESRTLAFAPESQGDVPLMLPLSSAEGFLRNAITPSLLRRVESNYARGQRHIRMFEIGTAFISQGAGVAPTEERHLSALFTGGRASPHWTGDPPAFDLWDLRGFLDVIAGDLGLRVQQATTLPAWADPAAAWSLTREDGSIAGTGARVAAAAIDAPAWADTVFAVEVDITQTPARPAVQFRPLPAFPAVERDLALLVRHDMDAALVLATVQQSAGPLLETVFPFDVYRGKGVDEAMRSLAVRLRFRATDRTLTDEEVDRAVARVLNRLKEDHGIERRG